MKVFYINIDKFKKIFNKDYLLKYADIELKTEKRFYEYSIGRYLVKNVANKYFNIIDDEIITTNSGKPIFKNSKLNFSISHSKHIVIACFDENPCGIDIEYIKNRDLNKLSNHFNVNFNSLNEFYEFWTQKEAKFKLGSENAHFLTKKNDNYIITIASANIISVEPIIAEFK